METRNSVLSQLDSSAAGVLFYEYKTHICTLKKHKIIVKAIYKGFNVILSFTGEQFKKYCKRDDTKFISSGSVVVGQHTATYAFTFCGKDYIANIPLSIFNSRICENDQCIIDALYSCLCSFSKETVLPAYYCKYECSNVNYFVFKQFSNNQEYSDHYITYAYFKCISRLFTNRNISPTFVSDVSNITNNIFKEYLCSRNMKFYNNEKNKKWFPLMRTLFPCICCNCR